MDKQYDQAFVGFSVQLGEEMRAARFLRNGLTQKLQSLSIRKMELLLARRSLVVINHEIAKATEERVAAISMIDDINRRYTMHLNTYSYA